MDGQHSGRDLRQANGGGGTGGFSDYWGVPAYQNGMTYNHGTPFGFRAVPDMALDANEGEYVYYNGRSFSIGGGTSIAAPKLAGFFAQENAYLLAIGNKCGTNGTSALRAHRQRQLLPLPGRQDAGLGPYSVLRHCFGVQLERYYGRIRVDSVVRDNRI